MKDFRKVRFKIGFAVSCKVMYWPKEWFIELCTNRALVFERGISIKAQGNCGLNSPYTAMANTFERRNVELVYVICICI